MSASKHSHQEKVVCRYDGHCTKAGCIFAHPKGKQAAVCKYDGHCTKAGCIFAHPKGKQAAVCRYDGHCTKAGCVFAHPKGKQAAVCRYDGHCTKAGCVFAHPKGKQVSVSVAVAAPLTGVTPRQFTATAAVTTAAMAARTTHVERTFDKVQAVDVLTRPSYDVVFVLDVSSSMSGTPSREMYRAVQSLMSEVLAENDGVGMVLFNHEATPVLQLTPMHKLGDLRVAIGSHLQGDGGFRCSGSTKLWDSVAVGMQMLAGRKRVLAPQPSHPFLVVLTDGGDNCSSAYSPEQVQAMLEKPKSANLHHMHHFHASLISVGKGSSDSASTFRRIAQGKQHLQHFDTQSASRIADMFVSVRTQMLQVIRTTVRSTTVEAVSQQQHVKVVHAKAKAGGLGGTGQAAVVGAVVGTGTSRAAQSKAKPA